MSWHLQLDFGGDPDWRTYCCGHCGAYQHVRADWAERTEWAKGDGGEPVQCLHCGQSAQLPLYAQADA